MIWKAVRMDGLFLFIETETLRSLYNCIIVKLSNKVIRHLPNYEMKFPLDSSNFIPNF